MMNDNNNHDKLSKRTSNIISVLSILLGFWLAKQLKIYREQKRTGTKQPMDKVDKFVWSIIAEFVVSMILGSVITGLVLLFQSIFHD